MKCYIRKNGNKKYPGICIDYFNGDYENYFFQLSVNGVLVVAQAVDGPRSKLIGIGSQPKDKPIIDIYGDEIEAYVLRFLSSHFCNGFDKPLSKGYHRINNYQFELLNYEEENGKKTISILVNGAFATVESTDDGEHFFMAAMSEANEKFFEQVLNEVSFFAKSIFKNDGNEDWG